MERTHFDVCGDFEVVAKIKGLAAVESDELELFFDG
jgi:hypothetical protein